ncbi:hypothetical protein CLF_101559 [Clonorchis sinensis]|uniref:Uncharacterized protein n=1 Tax=Clonorchis sinensis TaxID=79923 RepID=H2KP95_CLOSI|nr:hypothetical protein CLF_101559 [Clonorchis sinensis]
MWILEKRRPAVQWIGHPDTHVTCLHFWPDEILISQGRDGYIRFWTIPPYEVGQGCLKHPPTQAFAQIPTCDVTFCHMSFWPSVTPTGDLDPSIAYYLAHVPRGGEEEDNSTRESGYTVEVVELPKNVIVVHTEAGDVGSATVGSSSSGMCMALQGIPRHPNAKWNQSCLVLVANEAGQLLLFGDGVVLARLNNCLGTGIPIMAMSLQPIPAILEKEDKLKLLMALGGPSGGSADEPSQVDLLFVQLVSDETDRDNPVLRPISNQIPGANVGVSSLSWRQDGRLVAVGQWDGRIRLVERCVKQKPTVRCLGWLTSLGGLDEGELLGDWAATTVTKPHGPMIDQKSTTIRSCFFTPGSDWLVSAAPANAGAAGSILVWDVYRTCK